jgi:NADPH:quinone reductase-like Zn-dependent oxidoreductase
VYGAGEESIGRDDQPEQLPIPKPNADQMLVRIDSVGLCFSDVKIIRMGGSHPKLYNRDLSQEPTRLGHEASLTVIDVGENLKDQYHPGQRLAVQPDIYQDGKSTAYGYTIPGGLIQYHLIGPEILDTDEGACLLPVGDKHGLRRGLPPGALGLCIGGLHPTPPSGSQIRRYHVDHGSAGR